METFLKDKNNILLKTKDIVIYYGNPDNPRRCEVVYALSSCSFKMKDLKTGSYWNMGAYNSKDKNIYIEKVL